MTLPIESEPMLVDTFGRTINYLRLSVTDRCDFRCVYCMAEEMEFLPRQQLLTIEEMSQIAEAFIDLGVKKIRITGGEPLVRRNILALFEQLGQLNSLEELTLTTNGSQLSTETCQRLVKAGVKRINISLDSLQADRFKALTRTGELAKVLSGIDNAISAGLKVKLNSVILKNRNSDEIIDLVNYAITQQCDISFIEEMPLGVIDEHKRQEEFISSENIRNIIERHHDLAFENASEKTSGPSRYWKVAGQATRVGFIAPHSDNFCSSCNRVRLTATGQLLLCLGNENAVDLRQVIRQYPGDMARLKQTIIDAMQVKPEKHDFDLAQEPQILRFMNMTGG